MSAREQRGFTLIELAVVVAIVGLLLGAILAPLSTQIKVRKNRDADRSMRELRDALTGYAVVNGRLPCPDTDRDGLEDFAAVPPPIPCASPSGFVPWVTLDANPLDPWGRIVLYRVAGEFTFVARTGQPPAAFQLDLDDVAGADGRVDWRDLADETVTGMTQRAPVVLVSTGANGWGGTYLDGTAIPVPTVAVDGFDIGPDEAENLDGAANGDFIQRQHTPAREGCDETDLDPDNTPPCEFDDVVTWISGTQLMSLMVRAGQLP